jgi:hypothetical protein
MMGIAALNPSEGGDIAPDASQLEYFEVAA